MFKFQDNFFQVHQIMKVILSYSVFKNLWHCHEKNVFQSIFENSSIKATKNLYKKAFEKVFPKIRKVMELSQLSFEDIYKT